MVRGAGLPAGVLLAIFLLRLPSVIGEWGFASTDETSWISKNITPLVLGDFNPRLFEYPAGVVFTLTAAAYDLVYRIGAAAGVYGTREEYVALIRAEPWAFAVIGRLLIIAGNALGVVALYRLARRVTEPHVAAWAAVASGFTLPLAAMTRMHFVDGLVIPCLLAGLCLCLDIRDGRRDTWTLVLTGVVWGTLINLKIPYVLTVVAIAVALLLAPDRDRRLAAPDLSRVLPPVLVCAIGVGVWGIARTIAVPETYDPSLALGVGAVANFRKSVKALGVLAILAGAAALAVPGLRRALNAALLSRTARVTAVTAAATFMLWSPYYFADPMETVMGVIRMMRPVDWETVGPAPVTFHATILERSARELLGLPLGLVGLAGIAWAAWRRDARDLVILSPVAVWFAYTGFAAYTKLSLMWVYAPFLALYGARLAYRICGNGYHAVMPLLLLPAAWACADLAIANAFVPRADTRHELRAWYREHCPTGEAVAQDPGLLLYNAANPDYFHPLLSQRKLDELTVRYVMTNENIDAAYHLPPEHTRAFREELARRATRVAVFTPEPGKKAGPPIHVWKLK